MLTLVFSQLVSSLVFQWGEVTGDDDGLVSIWPAKWLPDTTAYYYCTLAVGGILILRHTTHSPFGYALRATRDSARQAEATGINIKNVQWMAFVIAGALAELAGELFVFSKGSIFHDELSISKSFDALIVVFLGGVKTLSGAVVGAAFMKSVKDWLTRMEYWRLILSLLIIAVVIIALDGTVGSLRKLGERIGLIREEESMR
ncbi:branched-chain amino acid ABC transporter permease [Breoghania sp.]|uniref:branched-chain amino acid ABC transporter permease n=1 Tax=Breoghania sp. TaxID=2065378 RepID=UPI002628F019|nr:branched-chain amino acid ABC transporter permease [Breoghania sp.]MDJ0932660.1 branched-chain amino acid ABC transporter permease [Breoghania sp.]